MNLKMMSVFHQSAIYFSEEYMRANIYLEIPTYQFHRFQQFLVSPRFHILLKHLKKVQIFLLYNIVKTTKNIINKKVLL